MKQAIVLLGLLFKGLFIFAQDTAQLSTDRPDQTDGANVLKKGQLQFETEMYYNAFRKGRAAIISSSLLRYGLLKNFELRLVVEEGRERDRFLDETTQGVYPLALSAKLAVLKDHPLLPDIIFIAYVKMPITRRNSDDVYWSPAFLIGLEKSFGKFTFATNTALKQAVFDNKLNWQASANIKYGLAKRVEVFTEYFAQYDKHESPMHNVDAGVLFYLSDNLMIHAAYGSTVFTQQYNNFFITGFAFRIK